MTRAAAAGAGLLVRRRCAHCAGEGTREGIDGAALRRWRKGQAFSLRTCAVLLGVSPTHLCDIEFERRAASPELVRELRRLVGRAGGGA